MPEGATGAQDNNRATARDPIMRSAAVTTQTVKAGRAVAPLRPCAPVALFSIMRSQAPCAVRHLALSGIRRPYDLRRYGLRRYGLRCYGLRRSGRRGYGGGDAGYSSEGFQLCLVIVTR